MSSKVERLVNLTVALLETRRPLTFRELRRITPYYDQADPESARRMFERDKDALRELGVPIETRPLDAFEAEVGYSVDRAAYELPDVELSAEQMTALAVAMRAVGDPAARLALTKIAARAPDPRDADLEALPRIDLDAEPVDRLSSWMVEGRAVSFPYRPARGEPAVRTVDPYAVVSRRGLWYLIGRDHDRDAVRAFRLDRLAGDAEPAGAPGAYEVPGDLDVEAHVHPVGDEIEATVAVDAELAWEAELRGGRETGEVHVGRPVFVFHSASPWRMATWALGHGPAVVVLAPASLRQRVVEGLRATLDEVGP